MPAQTSQEPIDPAPEAPLGAAGGAPATDLRADARRNRARVLKAAREVFASQGVDAPLSEVARRAGVGVATLYRRFPTRSDLVAAAFDDHLTTCATALDAALADPDPAHGLFGFLETVSLTLVTEHGFDMGFMIGFPEALDYNGEPTPAAEGLSSLIQRAREAGQLRDDFDPADIGLLFLAVSGLSHQPPETALPAARRLVTYLLQAFQGHTLSPLPPTAPMDLAGRRRPAAERPVDARSRSVPHRQSSAGSSGRRAQDS